MAMDPGQVPKSVMNKFKASSVIADMGAGRERKKGRYLHIYLPTGIRHILDKRRKEILFRAESG
jgi:hypothetical protein